MKKNLVTLTMIEVLFLSACSDKKSKIAVYKDNFVKHCVSSAKAMKVI